MLKNWIEKLRIFAYFDYDHQSEKTRDRNFSIAGTMWYESTKNQFFQKIN